MKGPKMLEASTRWTRVHTTQIGRESRLAIPENTDESLTEELEQPGREGHADYVCMPSMT